MGRVRVAVTVRARRDEVWSDLSRIDTHVEWMLDAHSIRFLTAQRQGVGTRFECDTRIGPMRLVDLMEITAWEPGRRMRVRHVGVVRGVGEFRLKARRRGRTRLVWRERVRFPWWMGGRLGALVGRPVLRLVWRSNLRRYRDRF